LQRFLYDIVRNLAKTMSYIVLEKVLEDLSVHEFC